MEDGTPLTRKALTKALRCALIAARVPNAELYKGHSFRRSGESNSGSSKQSKRIAVCYAFNGEASLGKWSSADHCLFAQRGKACRFQHVCMICAGQHAVYQNNDCAAQPRARAPVAQRR